MSKNGKIILCISLVAIVLIVVIVTIIVTYKPMETFTNDVVVCFVDKDNKPIHSTDITIGGVDDTDIGTIKQTDIEGKIVLKKVGVRELTFAIVAEDESFFVKYTLNQEDVKRALIYVQFADYSFQNKNWNGIDWKQHDEFKDNISNGRPVLTSIDLSGWGGHAVVTVGVERFTHEYTVEHSFLWWKWTATESEHSNYLRIIDGWNTSNDSVFIDLKGYWDTVTGRGFLIKN